MQQVKILKKVLVFCYISVLSLFYVNVLLSDEDGRCGGVMSDINSVNAKDEWSRLVTLYPFSKS